MEKICTECKEKCYDNQYPEIVFTDEKKIVCENCSIDYEEINGKIIKRKTYNRL